MAHTLSRRLKARESPSGTSRCGIAKLGLNLARERTGGVVVIFALALPIMIGALGLGIELGMWYLEKRRIQEAADSGALHGAFEFRANPQIATDPDLKAAAKVAVARSGYNDGNASIAVERPPLRGHFTSKPTAVEVTIDVAHPTYFINWFGIRNVPIQARAVAMQSGSSSNACFLALGNSCTSDSSKPPMFVNGTADLYLKDCGVHANGVCPESVDMGNNATVEAGCITGATQMSDKTADNYVGPPIDNDSDTLPPPGVYVDCGPPRGGMGNLPDPFLHLTFEPPAGSCSNSFVTASLIDGERSGPGHRLAELLQAIILASPAYAAKTGGRGDGGGGGGGGGGGTPTTILPGHYCGKTLNGDFILSPGVYYFDGTMRFHGNVSGDGVVIIITGSDASLDINAQADLKLKAPTQQQLADNAGGVYDEILGTHADNNIDGLNDWAGMLIYNATGGTNSCSTLNGGSSNGFIGAIYMPSDCVRFNGGSGVGSADLGNQCFMLIADTIDIIGNSRTSTAGCGSDYSTFLSAALIGLVE